MDYWLDQLLTGLTVAVIAGGMVYAASVFPYGAQTVWAEPGSGTQHDKNKMSECLLVYDDISNGRVQNLDFGHARDCKKRIGDQTKQKK